MKKRSYCFTGHRPNRLGGYDWDSNKNIQIRFNLSIFIQKIIKENPDTKFHMKFGGALGFDQFAFDVCYKLREQGYPISLEVCIPFKQQWSKWSKEDSARYYKQLKLANKLAYIDMHENYKMLNIPADIYHPAKMQKRNEYMVDESDVVIALWDGSKGGTANCVSYALKTCKTVLIINPDSWEIKEL